MKTAEKLAAGWLLTLGFMFLTISVSAVCDKSNREQATVYPPDDFSVKEFTPDYDYDAALGGLIFGLPTITLGGWLTLSLYRQSRADKKALKEEINQQIQSLFYQMITENKGRITVLGFAMQSQLPPAEARKYLDQKAKEFNANFKVNEEGAVSYYFDV
jgi:hypothetical protein